MLGIKLIAGILSGIALSFFCFHEPSIWTIYERTWYWAIVAGFTFTAIPYAGILMLIDQYKEGN
ncbi:hypothetical protein [Enterobacter cancerogenus]|uniref:hypothetical protein n=1 Tax=Enterobacter cancerogenus TaxID=69218 RepID=UPI0010C1DBDD|nr:hypothetical protein [Enterobacter cancerogenus]